MVTDLFPLELKGAETRRRGQRLIGPVDLRLDGQGVPVIIGPNGAGKTTLLRLMHGMARLTAGTITWACPQDAARQQQSFVFQRPILLRRSVEENLIYPLRLRGTSRSTAQLQAAEWAERVGLEPHLTRAAHGLSGGEQQKLAVARALITAPRVVFLDEPTASLDGRATREVEAILRDAKARGTQLILATHDMGQARRIGDEVIFLRAGQVHERAGVATFFDAPQTVAAQAFLRGDIVE